MGPNKLTDEEKKERIRLYNIEYRKKNADKIKELSRKYREEQADKIKESKKKSYIKNIDKERERSLNYFNDNKEKCLERQREYKKNNRDKLKQYQNEYNSTRIKNDPLYRLKHNIRSLIRHSIKRNGFIKTKKTHEILGCSVELFKQHLESQFESWMTWDNYGMYNGTPNYGWDIDHSIPSSTAITEDDVIKLNHYTNLKPMCSYYNRDIKKDKVD